VRHISVLLTICNPFGVKTTERLRIEKVMRSKVFIAAIVLSACGISFAAEPALAYPLWDGHESIADYAKRTGLEPEKSIDLGGSVKLELVLIPAGKFVMGTPEPAPPEITAFSGQVAIGIGAVLVLGLIQLVCFLNRERQHIAFSLRWLLAFCLACSVMVWGVARWRLALVQRREYDAAMARFQQVPTDEKPAHPVLISKPFYMGKYTVTQEQYQAIMGENPSKFKNAKNPVEIVSWNDAVKFCEKVKLKTGADADLPAEAQWEYACRAGTTTLFYSGDSVSDLDGVAWHASNSGQEAHPVGKKKANSFGLYDMHGNVWQWCHDAYTTTYESLAATAPFNAQGADRVLRGGSWENSPWGCRSAYRILHSRSYRGIDAGFRVVVPVPSSNAR
jgi:formylglycine-generating enzyme required for sulfatase activity